MKVSTKLGFEHELETVKNSDSFEFLSSNTVFQNSIYVESSTSKIFYFDHKEHRVYECVVVAQMMYPTSIKDGAAEVLPLHEKAIAPLLGGSFYADTDLDLDSLQRCTSVRFCYWLKVK